MKAGKLEQLAITTLIQKQLVNTFTVFKKQK